MRILSWVEPAVGGRGAETTVHYADGSQVTYRRLSLAIAVMRGAAAARRARARAEDATGARLAEWARTDTLPAQTRRAAAEAYVRRTLARTYQEGANR